MMSNNTPPIHATSSLEKVTKLLSSTKIDCVITTSPRNQPREQRPPLCFTDLPRSVRRYIYILAGLVRFCPISLNTEGANKTQFLAQYENDSPNSRCFYRKKLFYIESVVPTSEGFDCICTPLPTALLHVSKAISSEVSSILYSENKFRICRSEQGGLSWLLALSPAALGSLTSISIKLNACSCIPDHHCDESQRRDDGRVNACSECHVSCKIGNDLPASIENPDGQALISEWETLASRLAKYITPAQLELSLACDTVDVATAEKITEISLQLPQLTECSVRLGQVPNPPQRRLAEDAVLKLTHHPSHHLKPFNFLALPEEIQRQILRHTDLVCRTDILWSVINGISPFGCCLKCSDSLESCFCTILHAASSSITCEPECWVFPSSLFLINKKIHDFAMDIFYSQNTFVLNPKWNEDFSPDCTHILSFLNRLPSSVLPFLRIIRIQFFVRSLPFVGPDSEFSKNWSETMDFMSQHLRMDLLSLRIVDQLPYDLNPDLETQQWKMSQLLIRPFLHLPPRSKPKDLWIYFSPPLDGTFTGGSKWIETRRRWETELEKEVMGEEYEGAKRGKNWAVDAFVDKLQYMRDRESVFEADGRRIFPLRDYEPEGYPRYQSLERGERLRAFWWLYLYK